MNYEELHRKVYDELGDASGRASYDAALLTVLAPYLHKHKRRGGFMKKAFAVMAVLAAVLAMILAFSSCCKRVDPVTLETTTSFSNCIDAAQELFCNPTDQEKAELQNVIDFLATGTSISAMVFTDVPITGDKVRLIFSNLLVPGGCVIFTDFQLAVQWYNDLTAAMQTKTMTGKMALRAMPPAIPALWAAAKR